MSEHIHELTEKNFDSLTRKGKWVVDFWAEWCGPCKIMAPHFEAVAREMHGKINFAKVDIEEQRELPERFGFRSIPTTIFFENGEIVHMASGALNRDALKDIIESVF